MSEINLDLSNNKIERQITINQEEKNFLADLSVHEIAKVFTTFNKDKRILIVPIGFPQAGKSLLLSSLMYYSRRGRETLFKTDTEREFPYDKGHLAANDMIEAFDKGKLYDATQRGTLDLIGINIKPSKSKLPELKLAFLDLAGEDVKLIKASENGDFTDKINAVFNGLKIDKSPVIFTLITPFEPARLTGESEQNAHSREDSLHYDFLNYMTINQPQVLKSAKFFVIVSQWDKNPNENESIEDFIKTNRPSIYNYVKNENVVWGNYSVGKLLESNINGVNIQELVRINYDYPARFWKKLYHICTNNSLDNKSWFDKLFG
jgi:hypothetical protein